MKPASKLLAGTVRRVASMVVLLLHWLSCSSEAADSNRFWQLTLSYDLQGLNLVCVRPITATVKQVRTPSVEGAPLVLDYRVEWVGDGGRLLHSAGGRLPLGSRTILPEGDSKPSGAAQVPASGTVVVRVSGPADLGEVRELRFLRLGSGSPGQEVAMQAGDEVPLAFAKNENRLLVTESIQAGAQVAASPGPVLSEKVYDTGPDQNRLVLVVMGDGYTEADLAAGTFTSQLDRFLRYFFSTSPWNAYSNTVNVYRVDIASNESGADYEDASPENGGTLKDTYLDARFWSAGTDRSLYLRPSGVAKAFAAADAAVGPGLWDEILVFVNSAKYGGQGGAVTVSSVHPLADEIQLHELGHTLAKLADEYEYGLAGTNCLESSEGNVDCGSHFPDVKWKAWVLPETPIPTPETSAYAGVVGAFEGAAYQAVGVYRPMLDCKMRSLGKPFCPVCAESHVLQLFERVGLLDDAVPPFGAVEILTNASRVFSVNPILLSAVSYRWQLAGKELSGETNSTLTISASEVTTSPAELRVVATHSTPLVRAKAIEHTYLWRLNVVDRPSFDIADVYLREGDTGVTNLQFSVKLSFASTKTVTVDYATANGTATAGVDYLPMAGQLVFQPGETEKFIQLGLFGDLLPEGTEVFFLNLTNPVNAALVDSQAAVVIVDNDNPPYVTLLAPTNGAVFSADEVVSINADALDVDGRVASVDVLEEGSVLFSLNSEPYSTNSASMLPGIHTLTALATDNSGRTATSAPVRITILESAVRRRFLLTFTNTWRFDASTNDYGDLWKEPDFADGNWAGPSQPLFYYGNVPLPLQTRTFLPLTYNGARIRGYYYRTHFNFDPAPSAGLALMCSNLVDDGAVFYINGVEAGRLRMSDNPVTRVSFASSTPPGGNASSFEVISLDPTSLLPGDNVMAVEVHQESDASPDTAFAMSLEAVWGFAPVAVDLSEPSDRVVEQGRSTTLTASFGASPPLFLQWYRDGVSIPGATNQTTLIASMTEDTAGHYLCRASNALGTAESRTADIVYAPDRAGPIPTEAVRAFNLTNTLVRFSEAVDLASASVATNYTINAVFGGAVDPVTQAVPVSATEVMLTTLPPTSNLLYQLSVSGVRDIVGNSVKQDSPLLVAREIHLIAGDQHVWSYFQSDREPDPGWWSPGFVATQDSWSLGPALFHAPLLPGEPTLGPLAEPIRTSLSLTNPPGAQEGTVTYYFRTSFNLPEWQPGTRLLLSALVDDGAVFYLNGSEILRLGMSPAPHPVTYAQFATRDRSDDQNVYEGPFEVSPASLCQGENVMAVEVHQSGFASTDLSFSVDVKAIVPAVIPSSALRFTRFGDVMLLSWNPADAVLQETDDVLGSWQDFVGATNPQVVPLSNVRKFYRLRGEFQSR